MINPDIEIKESPIQGKGLFTKVAIKKGATVWISKGQEAAGVQYSNVLVSKLVLTVLVSYLRASSLPTK